MPTSVFSLSVLRKFWPLLLVFLAWWTFRIFFVLLGEGEGDSRGAGRGGRIGFLLKVPGGRGEVQVLQDEFGIF